MIATLLELTYNLALLVALSVISGFIRQRRRSAAWGPMLQGLLFGGAAVIGMMKPLVLGPGLIFDGRSVMLSLCGLFFGPVAAGVAGGLALLYRIYLGGPGVYMGVSVIAASALLGLSFHQLWVRRGQRLSVGRVWGLGLLVHGVMLLLMLLLPAGTGLAAIKRLGFPILLAYPLVMVLIGQVLSSQAAGVRAVEALRESEQNYRTLIDNLSAGLVVHGADTSILFSNGMASTLLGLTADQMQGKSALDPRWRFLYEDGSAVPHSDYPVNRVLTSGKGFQSQVLGVCHPDCAKPSWMLCNAYPVKDALGRVEQAVVTFTDITARKQAEEALQLTRFSIESASDAMYWLTPEARIVDVNEAACRLLGYSRSELLAVTVPDVDANYDAEKWPGHFAELRQMRSMTFESQQRHRDGRLIPVEVVANYVKFGEEERNCAFVRDITERKRAEALLRQGAEDLRESQRIAKVGSWRLDIATNRVVWSDELYRMYGFDPTLPPPDFIEHQKLFTPDSWKRLSTGLANTVETGNPYDVELEMVRDGKASGWMWAYGKAELDANGMTVGLIGAAQDITERKQAEEALQHSEQKFRTLFENLTEGVALHELVTDAADQALDYRLLAVNPAYETHTGLVAATAAGLLGTEMYGTEPPPYLKEYSQVALGGEPCVFETFFPPLEKHFRISVVSPKKGQFATVFEDITERKRSEEELKQKNAEMERFTYMISHDLKSPLVTVRTFLGYLEQDLEQGRADRVAKDMGFIRNATGKMGRLLEDLLEVSRVGRVVNPPVRVSLPDLIADALAAVAGAISSRGVAIQAEASPIVLSGDRPRLEEIWQNLVENAVKYMGEEPAPRIELGAEGTGVDTVFFVRDNGLGIDPKFQDKVFGLFEQLDATSEGTGLGLALVKRIVELNGGRIWVESEGLGRGTCFRFTLPLALKGLAKERQ